MSFVAASSRPAVRCLRSSTKRTSAILSQTRNHSWGYSTCRNLPKSGRSGFSAWCAYGMAAAGALGYAAWKHEQDPNVSAPTLLPTIQCDSLSMREKMEAMIKREQDNIVRALEKVDGSTFRRDAWERPDHGGGGISCVLQDGNVFEKAGVNVSVVQGTLPPAAVRQMRVNHKSVGDGTKPVGFFAAGLSMVLHPKNPMAPTVHLNYRYFETTDQKGEKTCWWFGGGTDLTPSYLFPEDAVHFHQVIKDECDKHDKTYYKKFKKWCDEYFWVKHRNEARGVGGIFFDDLDDRDPEELFKFAEGCLKAFLPSYIPIVEKRKNMPYTLHNKEWQQLRRGRYVEFNLVHDRGTAFGLNTPSARVESILMSLPLTAAWKYMHEPTKGSPEEQLVEVLQHPKDWIPLD